MARLPPSTLLLKSSPAAPLFRFASLPRPLVPRLHGSLRPGASRSSLAPPPLAFRSATKPRSSMAKSLLSRLLRTSRTAARWFLSASSPSHSAAMWPGILLFTPSPSRICSRSLATLSFPLSSSSFPRRRESTPGWTHGPPPPRGRQETRHSRKGGNPSLHHQQCMDVYS